MEKKNQLAGRLTLQQSVKFSVALHPHTNPLQLHSSTNVCPFHRKIVFAAIILVDIVELRTEQTFLSCKEAQLISHLPRRINSFRREKSQLGKKMTPASQSIPPSLPWMDGCRIAHPRQYCIQSTPPGLNVLLGRSFQLV